MKKIFRWLRGELNGFYIQGIYSLMNDVVRNITDFLYDFSYMQFNESNMSFDEISNLAKFAGVFMPRLSVGEKYGALRMTEGYLVNGAERSERGLLERAGDRFVFYHTEQDEYDDDINTLATDDLKTSMVEDDAVVVGYISSSATDIFDENGNVKEEVILDEPPEDEAYTEFYGNQYLRLAELTEESDSLPKDIYFNLISAMQRVRYNSENMLTLIDAIDILCPNGFVKIVNVIKEEGRPLFELQYRVDYEAETSYKFERIKTLEYLMEQKFPTMRLVEVN